MSAERPASLWRNRDFMVLWGGQSLSLLGGEITVLALPLIALSTLDVTAFQVGLLTTAATLPWLIASLPAGVIVDRVRRRSVMLWCDLGRAAALATIPLVASFGVLTLGQLYLVAAASGTLSVLFSSAFLSTPPSLVPPSQLTAANGMLLSATAAAGLAGPGLAALLVGAVGPAHAIVADAASYLVSVGSLLLIGTVERRPVRTDPSQRHFGREMVAGLRLIRGNRVLTALTVTNSIGNFLLTGISAILLLYLVRGLDWSVHAVGVVFGVGAAGGLLGSLVTSRLIERFGMVRVLLFSQLLFAPAELLIVVVGPGLGGQVTVALAMAIGLACATVYNIAQRAYRMHSCPPDALGRLNATASWLQWGLRPLAGVAGGGLATLVGQRWAIGAFAVVLPSCPLILWLSPLRGQYLASRHRPHQVNRPAEEESWSSPIT